MIKLNEFVDNVYCLNLDRRKDRWEKVSKEFDKFSDDVLKAYVVLLSNAPPIQDGDIRTYQSLTQIMRNPF